MWGGVIILMETPISRQAFKSFYCVNLLVGGGERAQAHSPQRMCGLRGKFARAGSLLPPSGNGSLTRVIRLGSKYLYPLSHLTSPKTLGSDYRSHTLTEAADLGLFLFCLFVLIPPPTHTHLMKHTNLKSEFVAGGRT